MDRSIARGFAPAGAREARRPSFDRRALLLRALGSFLLVLWAPAAFALPAAGPIAFIAPTPAGGETVTTSSISVRLQADCTVDPGTLVVTLTGVTIPAASFLPFGACSDGRMSSQTVVVGLTLPSGTSIGGGAPSTISAGDSVALTASGTADSLQWNFDGGAAPATGGAVSPTFAPAGDFTIRLQGLNFEDLAASAMDGGELVNASRNFRGADPNTPTHQLAVAIPADVDFRNFESSHVHPLALSASGSELYAVNTPEGRLEIFSVGAAGALTHGGSVAVGVDPVSLAVRSGTNEVWVANHLSDSVSIVDVAAGKVLETLSVGDEPNDIVFASGRAFVATAGQFDEVEVYTAASRALLTTISIDGDDPRAMAVNAAGDEVYLVVLESGNQSTALNEALVVDGGGPPPPSPARTAGGSAPEVGLIVQFDGANWRDDAGNNWSSYVDFTMPDKDVFVIDANAGTPSVVDDISGVGTLLFDLEVRPSNGDLFVSNTDARNLIRFEPNLRGHLVETRISVVDPVTESVSVDDLNPHINYAITPGPLAEIAASLAHPGDGVFTASGGTYYLTALGSQKVAEINPNTGAVTDLIDVGDGPSGVALNEADDRLYVMNRFTNTISIVDTTTNSEVGTIGVAGPSAFDPSPDVVQDGRKFLYDGQLTSGHGDIACATCHPFANFDNLAWDLGDPTGSFVNYASAPWVQFFLVGAFTNGFDPEKGPMTTQTLRGLTNTGPFHWRGDREDFQAFNPSFEKLLGLAAELSTSDMDAYADFIHTVKYPPNPYRGIDGTAPTALTVPNPTGGGTTTANPVNGFVEFINEPFDGGALTCNQCHTAAGTFGTNQQLFNGNLEGETQDFKIPQLRNMYEKLGFDVLRPNILNGNANNFGDSTLKAGFGFLHDGSVSLTEFLAAPAFNMSTQEQADQFAFMIAFPTETVSCLGATVHVDAGNSGDAGVIATIAELVTAAEGGTCDLIVKGDLAGAPVGFVYDSVGNVFLPDQNGEPTPGSATLRTSVAGSDVLTYTGVSPGSGTRLGIDRDRDGFLDRGEVASGTDPADPNSNAWGWSP